MSGYVYILSNPSMPNLVKIGHSINGGRRRAAELYTTGVPQPFVLEFEILVSEPLFIEKLIHDNLSDCRIAGREFFEIDVVDAVRVVTDVALSSDWSLSATDECGGECVQSLEAIVESYPDIGGAYGELYLAAAIKFLTKEHIQAALDAFDKHLAELREAREGKN